MAETDSLSRFELVARELRGLGLTLRRLPGEYCVNFRNGGDATAAMAEELKDALQLGRNMAAAREAETDAGSDTRSHSLKSARKYRRRFIRRHNKGYRRRAIRRQRGMA
jgi:hypothetical protein